MWQPATLNIPRSAHDARVHDSGALLVLLWWGDRHGEMWAWELGVQCGDGWRWTRIVESRRRLAAPFAAAEAALADRPW